jgi:hypothetical protein
MLMYGLAELLAGLTNMHTLRFQEEDISARDFIFSE